VYRRHVQQGRKEILNRHPADVSRAEPNEKCIVRVCRKSSRIGEIPELSMQDRREFRAEMN
jgi:hypothetical protein